MTGFMSYISKDKVWPVDKKCSYFTSLLMITTSLFVLVSDSQMLSYTLATTGLCYAYTRTFSVFPCGEYRVISFTHVVDQ